MRLSNLTARGFQHAYIDGGVTIQQFLRAGLIQRLTITRVPVLVGEAFRSSARSQKIVRLQHISTHDYASGLKVKTEYRDNRLRSRKFIP